jgi:hypothetical protein
MEVYAVIACGRGGDNEKRCIAPGGVANQMWMTRRDFDGIARRKLKQMAADLDFQNSVQHVEHLPGTLVEML